MFVTYQPEDGNPPQVWEFDPKRVRVSEQVLVEKAFGGTWAQFQMGVLRGQALARRVLLWHLVRRDHPTVHVKVDETPDFMDCELLVEQTPAEMLADFEVWVKGGGLEDEDGPTIAASFEEQLEAARAKFGDEPGKAPSTSALEATSGT